MGEYLSCPSLDNQLEEKCCFKNPPKLKIYFSTKVRILSFTNTKLIDKWDGNFFLGKYDCTSNLHFSMAEFEYYSTLNIPGFPKTFRTYEKHKKENSLKYLSWMKSIGERKLTQPGQ